MLINTMFVSHFETTEIFRNFYSSFKWPLYCVIINIDNTLFKVVIASLFAKDLQLAQVVIATRDL